MKQLFRTTITFTLAITLASVTRSHTMYPNGMKQYGLMYYDANYFYVWDDLAGKAPGTDYVCITMEYQICTVISFTTPDASNRIPINSAWPIVTNAIYIPLDY